MSRSVDRSPVPRTAPLFLAVFLLAGCQTGGGNVQSGASVSRAQGTSAAPTPSTPPPDTGGTVSASPMEQPPASGKASLAATMSDVGTALDRFKRTPPAIHATYEARTRAEGTILRDEVWVDWPAFRLVQQVKGSRKRLVIATNDGKRFGYRDPASGEVGITRDFGEGAFVLLPVLQYFGEVPAFCTSPDVMRTESILGRNSIHIGCDDTEGWDQWVDAETGLMLRRVARRPDPQGSSWAGFAKIQFDPVLDQGLFDPRSV
jgi:hypothetical protein